MRRSGLRLGHPQSRRDCPYPSALTASPRRFHFSCPPTQLASPFSSTQTPRWLLDACLLPAARQLHCTPPNVSFHFPLPSPLSADYQQRCRPPVCGMLLGMVSQQATLLHVLLCGVKHISRLLNLAAGEAERAAEIECAVDVERGVACLEERMCVVTVRT